MSGTPVPNKPAQLELPLGLPLPFYKPSGDLFDASKDCTLPLSKEANFMKLEGTLTETERKLWLALVHFSFDDMEVGNSGRIFQTHISKVVHLFRELGDSETGKNGSSWLIKSAKKLGKCQIVWDTPREEGFETLLVGLRYNPDTGNLFWQFGHYLTILLLNNKVFGRVNVHLTIGLSGKYAVSLYSLLTTIVNRKDHKITVALDELRECFNVGDKLKDWRDFNKKALEPALAELSKKKEQVGFVCQHRTISTGRKITAIEFTAIPNDKAVKVLERTSRKDPLANLTPSAGFGEHPSFAEKDLKQFQNYCARWGLGYTTELYAWWDGVKQKGEPLKSPAAHFMGFLKSRAAKGEVRAIRKRREEPQLFDELV